MNSSNEALNLSTNIVLDIEKGRIVYQLIPQVMRLAQIFNDKELEDVCYLELSGYNQNSQYDQQKIEYYEKLVGRKTAEGAPITHLSLNAIERSIEIYEKSDKPIGPKIDRIQKLIKKKQPIEAYFIKKVYGIHNSLKNYYASKIIDDYLTYIKNKLDNLEPSLNEIIQSIYDNLYSTNKSNLLNVGSQARRIMVCLGNILYSNEKTIIEDGVNYHVLKNGDKLIINNTDSNYINKLSAFLDSKVQSKTEKGILLSDIKLLSDNIDNFAKLVSKYSHEMELEDKDIYLISSMGIRIIVIVGDILNYI